MKINTQKIKRFSCRFAFFLTVCLLLLCMSAPAFAALNQVEVSGTWRLNDELTGTYGLNEDTSFSLRTQMGNDSFYVSCNHISFSPYNEQVAELVYTAYSFDPMPPNLYVPVDIKVYEGEWYSDVYGDGIKTITFNGATFISEDFYEWLTLNATPVDVNLNVSETLPVVLGWVGSVVDSLLSGELSGLLILLAIPVAIVIVFLGARLLRRMWWGA